MVKPFKPTIIWKSVLWDMDDFSGNEIGFLKGKNNFIPKRRIIWFLPCTDIVNTASCGISTWTSFAFCDFILTCSSCCQSRNLAWHFWFKYLSCSDLVLCCSCFKHLGHLKPQWHHEIMPFGKPYISYLAWLSEKSRNWNNGLGCDGVD